MTLDEQQRMLEEKRAERLSAAIWEAVDAVNRLTAEVTKLCGRLDSTAQRQADSTKKSVHSENGRAVF